MKKNKALINFYTRLLLKGQKKESEIPDDIIDEVLELYKILREDMKK